MIPTRYIFVLGSFALAMLLYVDRICISAAQGPISSELGLSDTEFGWALSAFALGYAICQTPMGMLADRFGPRLILTAVVALWSAFTGLTGATTGLTSLLIVRFLFGAGEAGAYPGVARAIFSWIPMRERGVVQGVVFSGGRLGAAFALPMVAWLVDALGWRPTFVVLMLVGTAWAVVWFVWFRNDPAEHSRISPAERELIVSSRQQVDESAANGGRTISMASMFRSGNMWLLMAQYFCSNFTFFFCLSWLFPYLRRTYDLDSVSAGWYAAAPFVCGALGNIFAGWLTDRIYRQGHWRRSRQIPAIIGFALAAGGLVGGLSMESAGHAVACLSLAVFGADMTLSPSWAVCVDIGRRSAGAVSGTMNMAGNLGSFITSLAFPYLMQWTGSAHAFFYVAAGLNLLAVAAWLLVRPERPLDDRS